MKTMRSSGQITVRSANHYPTAVPIQKAVESMIAFFEGFEYGETAIVMSHGDYMEHFTEFERTNEGLTLCGIPVYLHGMVNNGQLFLTSIHEAEKIMFASEPESE